MNERELKRRFPNASAAFVAANTDGPEFCLEIEEEGASRGKTFTVRSKLERNSGNGALVSGQAKKGYTGRVLVRVTSVRRRLIDEDNLCSKYVVDCCRYAGLISSDDPGKTQIQSTQRKAGKEEAEHTIIEIFAI